MDLDPSTFTAPADQYAHIINGLCRVIGARARALDVPMPVLVFLWFWLRRSVIRLGRLAERVAAGERPRPAPSPRRPAASRPKPPLRLPRERGWLVRLLLWEAAGHGSQLRHLLATEEMAALLAAAPQARRLLNPVCRMLGVTLPPAPPKPPPAPPPAADAPAVAPAGEIPGSAAPPRRPPRPTPRPGASTAPQPDPRACGPPPVAA